MIFNSDGLFKRTNDTAKTYNKAKAKETLEIAFSDLQIEKYKQALTIETLDMRITEKIGQMGGTEIGDDKTQVIVDGYIFLVDRSVPKIIDCLGQANEVIVTSKVTQNGEWQNPIATVTGTIIKYGGGTVTNVTGTATNGVTITGLPTTGGNFTIPNIATDTVITITITTTDSLGKTKEHTIEVKLIRDETPPEIKTAEAKVDGMKITIKGAAEDKESGIISLRYSITPTTGFTSGQNEGDLPQNGTPIEITSTAEETYAVTIIATNGAGTPATKEITGVKTIEGGVIKHIRTSKGLEEVNTKGIYGEKVTGYTCDRKKDDETELEWQIFYIDETKNEEGKVIDSQVYLIAKDYAVPPTTGTEMTCASDKSYYWNTTVLNKYITNLPTNDTTTPLGIFMGKFLSDYAGASASYLANLQATNYMLDQEMWKEYKGTDAELVFGGPSLPLLQASYNDVCKNSNKMSIAKWDLGYRIRKGNGSMYDTQGGFGNTNTQKRIYFYGDYNMWIASPSNMESRRILVVTNDGYISAQREEYRGSNFRPIVSLQSTVHFTAMLDGSYTITN